MVRVQLTALPPDHARTTRRALLQSLGVLAAVSGIALADSASAEPRTGATGASSAAPLSLPLRLDQLVNHIGSSVPDVVRSATFYSHLFEGGELHGQEKPELRYSINFHPGALSIGPLSGAPGGEPHAYIDHFCVHVLPYDAAAWRARLDREGIRYTAGGSFVDIGGISVQLSGARRRVVPGKRPSGDGGFQPMAPLYRGEPLVQARGFENVMLHIADLDASAALFRRLFGLVPHRTSAEQIFFQVGATRLGLRQAAPGVKPSIASFGIKVAKLDAARVGEKLEALGATVQPVERAEMTRVLRFTDPDGIQAELRAV